MPLPLLFIGVAAVTGLIGAGKTVKAVVDNSEAKDVNQRAQNTFKSAKGLLNKKRKECGNSLHQLGEKKIRILNGSIKDFVHTFEQLKNIEVKNSVGINEASKLRLDSKEFSKLKDMSFFASSLLEGAAGGVLGGVITAYAAYGAAGYLASASTGTAIASLSGIAAQNATLAFFGGGSLAAGGLGVAGGTAVLGGLVAGPALAVMGFWVGAKASKAKDDAYANLAQAKKIAEELRAASSICTAISSKCNLFVNLMTKLDKQLSALTVIINNAIAEHGTDFQKFSSEQRNATAAAASLAKALKTAIDTPILDKSGNITSESSRVLTKLENDTQQYTRTKPTISANKAKVSGVDINGDNLINSHNQYLSIVDL